MKHNDLPHKKIVFVCTNRRPDGERVCCAAGGGDAFRDKLKAMVKERRLRNKIRVSASGCMDRCEEGPNIMVFPDNVWYSAVTEEDLEPLLESLIQDIELEEPAH